MRPTDAFDAFDEESFLVAVIAWENDLRRQAAHVSALADAVRAAYLGGKPGAVRALALALASYAGAALSQPGPEAHADG